MPPLLSRLATGFLLVSFGLVAQATGQTTNVPATRTKTAETSTSKRAEKKIDLNTASLEQLQELPGIGPARAAAIIKARPLKSIEDLKSIRGITPAMIKELEPLATAHHVEPATPATTTTPKIATPRGEVMTKSKAATSKGAGTSASKTAAVSSAKEDDPEHQARKKAALPAGKKINLNTATTEELEELPYIGPVRSAAIIKARPFDSIDDVMKVEGIKEGIFGHIKDHISVK